MLDLLPRRPKTRPSQEPPPPESVTLLEGGGCSPYALPGGVAGLSDCSEEATESEWSMV